MTPDAQPGPPRKERPGWLRSLFSREPDAVAETGPTLIDPTETADLADLAAQLSALIASARGRLDGAVAMVDRSADEAAAYGQALAVEADAIDRSEAGTVGALVTLTRAMIERTADAETRLRATKSELATLQQELSVAQETAERDMLTGLPNRRALAQALTGAVDRARAADSALALAFCDIDNFKRLNDVHGHAVGDRVLRLVADCLAEGAGEGAFVGRHGGEEFVLLFEGLSALDAAARTDTIRAGLAARVLRSRSDGSPIGSVSFSAGVAGLTGAESGEALLHRADTALYRAKQDGRNRVVIDTGMLPS